MCGFLFGVGEKNERFEKALGLMAHRGPDAWAMVNESGALLGHRRLCVVDLGERSNQPFYSADGRHVIVYNGEIYNFRELAQKHGLKCRTASDTEVLLLLFEKLGRACLDELNGMFAFVIFDLIDGGVFAARDRLGIKPLYVDRRGEHLAFASELAPLLALNGEADWDEEGLRQYMKLRTCFREKTIYRGIEQLPAGCYLENGEMGQYWSLPEGAQEAPDDEELEWLIRDAVRLRCQADVPIGSYLSGGLDSTIIAGLSTAEEVWSVGFEEMNEFAFSELAAKHFGLRHHGCVIGSEEFEKTAEWMIKKRREPLSVPNEVMIYSMTQQVKSLNTVVLSGEGADELFFGYDRIFRWAKQSEAFSLREFDEHYSYGSHRDDEILDSVLRPHLLAGKDTLDVVGRFFQVDHLQGLLRRLDNSTMLCSVEARVPFVDHRLIERMAGVAAEYRMAGGVVKAPLKRIFSDLVPRQILERKKVGFPVPLTTIPYYDAQGKGSVMDQWLKFNLRILSGCDGLYYQTKTNI